MLVLQYNMTTRGGERVKGGVDAWEPTFIEALEPALEALAKSKKRLVCNAGASDTAGLARHVDSMVKSRGLKLKTAWIEGDEVYEEFSKMDPKTFISLTTNSTLEEWKFKPIYAQAYLGCVEAPGGHSPK